VNRLKFSLSSDQLELLLAFESSQGLGHLAEVMARDQSVISRNLQRIAEDQPVLKKVKGRWELTPLGIQINRKTKEYLKEQSELFNAVKQQEPDVADSVRDSVLVVINAQVGLLDSTQEGRNNSDAEKNIHLILSHWRNKKRKIIHVKHVSENPGSIFFRDTVGCEFIDELKPHQSETIIEKRSSSAFFETSLDEILSEIQCATVVLCGFTANECIDTTARDASGRGYTTLVVSDATATFDMRDRSGKLVKADRIHKLTLLNLNAFHAKVISSKEILF
jgi:nicotinamidase-related amidase